MRLFPVRDNVSADPRPDAGWVINPDRFKRFNQVNDVFNRSWWDEAIRTDKTARFYQSYREPLAGWKKARGFRHKDYALRNASWHGADIFAELKEDEDRREGFLDPLSTLRDPASERMPVGDSALKTAELKHLAKVLGADLIGVAERDDRWIYSHRYSRLADGKKPNELDESLDRVIVIGQAMDQSLIATAPSALAGAATGLGYSKDVIVLLSIAQYIRNLGYSAVPTLNDTALAIPYAIKAGLGEYARNGLVITPEHGSNVRFGKIFTDFPLDLDEPIRFGVAELCKLCRACSTACPSSAIPDGAPSDTTHNVSNLTGIIKWTVDGEACFNYWAKINSDCSVCIRVCPYTRDHTKLVNRAWLRMSRVSAFRRLALRLDERSGRANRVSSLLWWAKAGGQDPGDQTGVPVELMKRNPEGS